MTTNKIKVYSIAAKQIDHIEVDLSSVSEVKPQLIKDSIVAIRYNQRTWSASTLTRTEVNRTGRKMYRQKGTGRARHGSLAAPIFVGGGVAHGPQHRDVSLKVNRKEKQAVVRFMLSEMVKNDKIISLKVDSSVDFAKPKTKIVADFLKSLSCNRRVLFLLPAHFSIASDLSDDHLILSLCNLPFVTIKEVHDINAYDLANTSHLICVNQAAEDLAQKLQGATA